MYRSSKGHDSKAFELVVMGWTDPAAMAKGAKAATLASFSLDAATFATLEDGDTARTVRLSAADDAKKSPKKRKKKGKGGAADATADADTDVEALALTVKVSCSFLKNSSPDDETSTLDSSNASADDTQDLSGFDGLGDEPGDVLGDVAEEREEEEQEDEQPEAQSEVKLEPTGVFGGSDEGGGGSGGVREDEARLREDEGNETLANLQAEVAALRSGKRDAEAKAAEWEAKCEELALNPPKVKGVKVSWVKALAHGYRLPTNHTYGSCVTPH